MISKRKNKNTFKHLCKCAFLPAILILSLISLNGADDVLAHGGGALGRETHYGYFNGNHDARGSYVFSSGAASGDAGMPVYNADQFVSRIRGLLSGGNAQDRTGAAFIINSMLGISGPSADRTPSSSRINTWERRVRAYDDAGQVEWDKPQWIPAGTLNSYYQGSTYNDDAFYYSNSGETQDVILFKDSNGNEVFRIKKNCGNPIGVVRPLQDLEKYWNYTVSFNANSPRNLKGNTPYPYRNAGSTIDLASTVRNNGDGRGAQYDHQFVGRRNSGNLFNIRMRRDEGGLNPGASRSRTAAYRIPDNMAHDTNICFMARVNPFRGQSSPTLNATGHPNGDGRGWRNSRTLCIRVNNPQWNYIINWAPGKSPADQDGPAYPKPGDSIRIGSTVTNNGNGRGADYHHWLEPNGVGTKRRVNNQGHKGRKQGVNSPYNGMAAGGSRTLQTYGSPLYTVTSSAGPNRVVPHHNDNLCFTSFVTNVHGWTIGRRVTNPGPREVRGEKCMSVYNKRFNFDQPTLSGTPSSFIATSSGTTITGIDAQALNDSCQGSDQGGALCDSSAPYGLRNNSYPGEARNAELVIYARRMSNGQVYTVQSKSQAQVNHTSAITINNASFTTPANTQPGEEFCFYARITPERGYSDGEGSTGSRQSAQSCSTASIATTTHTHQGSIWSGTIFGFPFDINDPALQNNYPLSCDPSETPNSGIIRGIRNGSATSWAHHGIVALDALSTFFTQGTLHTNELLLANNGTSGNSGLTACVPNLPDALALDENRSVGAGYTITNGDLTSADGKIIGFDAGGGDLTFNLSSGTPFNKRTTVVIYNVNDVFVTNNVAYRNSNNPNYTGANPVSQIPALALVVDGNTRISENVTQLDGLYYATGTLETCAEHKSLSTNPNVCGQQLIVNGALVSDNIALKRTYGTDAFADGNDNEPAEVINMTGEMYIAPPPLRLKNGIRGGGIEVQDVIDLPPLF